MRRFVIETTAGTYIRISKRAARTMFAAQAPIVLCSSKFVPTDSFASQVTIDSKRWIESAQATYGTDAGIDIVETAWRNVIAQWEYANKYTDSEYIMFYLFAPKLSK